MVPVEFAFYRKAYFDRNSFQVHDEDNPEAIQTLADDSPEQLKVAEKTKPEFEKELKNSRYDESKGEWSLTIGVLTWQLNR